jgi:tight adherence protein B
MSNVLFDSAFGPIAVGLLVGCLMLVAALVALARPKGAWLRSRIGPYDGPETANEATDESTQAWKERMDNVFGATERRFGGTSAWRGLERMLERADERTPAVQLVWLCVVIGVGLALLLGLVSQSLGLALLAGVAGGFAPIAWLSHKGRRRIRAFDDQLADVLTTMAGSLQVGHSFHQSMQAIVAEGQQPVASEFERALTETRFGREMDEALDAMAARIGSKDLDYVIMSVRMQRQVGGSLAGLFHSVAETVRDRQQFRRKVKALTAMGRMSAYVLIALPFVTGLGLFAVNRDYMTPLFTTGTGRTLVIASLVMIGVGSLVLRRIVSFKG